jgi:6-pyruvoyltetrahydropterin/6-carboxytetrahydropterin synthase
MYELTVEAGFSSAHNIRGYEGACENLHGHNWKVEVHVEAKKLDQLGMVVDFRFIKTRLKELLDRLDHKYLNEIPPFDKENATAENIARYVYKELSKKLNDQRVKVAKIRVWESDHAAASYCE